MGGGHASTRVSAYHSRPRLPGSTSWSRPSRRFAPCGSPAPGNTGASGSACRRRPAIRGRCHRSRSSSAAAARSARWLSPPGSATAAIFPPTSARWIASSPSCASIAWQAGRDPAQVEVTVLDIPVIGRDREHAGSIVEKLRGRTTAAAFAQRHHACTADDHIGRYRLLAERGVPTQIRLPPRPGRPRTARRASPRWPGLRLTTSPRPAAQPDNPSRNWPGSEGLADPQEPGRRRRAGRAGRP